MSIIKNASTLHEIAKMAAEMCDDPNMEQRILDHAERTKIGSKLEYARDCIKGWSQLEMARKMGYTYGKLYRFEMNYPDADLKLGDIQAYVKALGMDLNIMDVVFDAINAQAAKLEENPAYSVSQKYDLPKSQPALCVAETPAEYKTKSPKRALKKVRA